MWKFQSNENTKEENHILILDHQNNISVKKLYKTPQTNQPTPTKPHFQPWYYRKRALNVVNFVRILGYETN